MKKYKFKIGLFSGRLLIRVFLFLWALIIILPLIWIILTSFKTNVEFFESAWSLPTSFNWQNYVYAWTTSNISMYFLNSLFLVVGTLTLTLLMSTSTAYIISKFEFKGVKVVGKVYMLFMMVPQVLLLIPLFFQCLKWQMTDSLLSLVLLYSLQSMPFSVFLLTPFMKSIHNSFIEAAVIDGASEFQIYRTIILPMAKSSIFVVSLLSIMGTWNEFIMALVFISDQTKYTVPIGISYLVSGSTYGVDYGGLFAGLVIAMLPVLIIYSIFQKEFQVGMSSSDGIKG